MTQNYSRRVAVEYTDCITSEGLDFPPDMCPLYDTKQSDGETSVMMYLWGIHSTSTLPSLPGLLWLGVVAPDTVLSMS